MIRAKRRQVVRPGIVVRTVTLDQVRTDETVVPQQEVVVWLLYPKTADTEREYPLGG